MRNALKRFALGFEPKQEYIAVGLPAPQSEIRVWLHDKDARRDVTFNHSIASLRPLLVAIGTAPDTLHTQNDAKRALVFETTTTPARVLGKIALRLHHTITRDDGAIALYETMSSQNFCLAPLRVQLHQLYRRWEMRRRPAHNFRMKSAERECSYVLYICPRPVVLVSTVWQDAGNLFPMDLVGTLAPHYFVLALRNTNPSVAFMRDSRRIALANIPPTWQDIAYALGKQHGQARVDWQKIPFETILSPQFGIPVPRAALAVREVYVEQTESIGSHTFFVTRTLRQQTFQHTEQLYHIHEYYNFFRQAQGYAGE